MIQHQTGSWLSPTALHGSYPSFQLRRPTEPRMSQRISDCSRLRNRWPILDLQAPGVSARPRVCDVCPQCFTEILPLDVYSSSTPEILLLLIGPTICKHAKGSTVHGNCGVLRICGCRAEVHSLLALLSRCAGSWGLTDLAIDVTADAPHSTALLSSLSTPG